MEGRRATAAFIATSALVLGIALAAVGSRDHPSTLAPAGASHLAARALSPVQLKVASEETALLGGHRPREPFVGALLIAALVGVLLAGRRRVLGRHSSGAQCRLVRAWSVRGPPSARLART